MDSDFPWVYVAMIFIAFVSWVRARLQEAAELRRARALKKKAAGSERRVAPDSARVSPYLEPSPQASRSRPSVPEPIVTENPVTEMPRSFREILEVFQEQLVGQNEPQSTSQSAPPPLPVTHPVNTGTPVLRDSQGLPTLPRSAASPRIPRDRKTQRKTSGELSRLLKTRGTLREALILKEILDKPVALRD